MKFLALSSLLLATLIPVGATANLQEASLSREGKTLPLVEIVKQLESDGYGPFSELSLDRRDWEVEVRKGKESLELRVDAETGKILSEHRDDADKVPGEDAMLLSKLLQKLSETSKYKDFEEVSFESRYWEIEVIHDGQKRELHVDPNNANIISDRLDD